MIITEAQHLELKFLKNQLATLIINIEANDIQEVMTIEQVTEYACDIFDFTLEQLREKNRKKDIVLCRRFIILFCREELKLSYNAIGDYLNFNHANIMHHRTKFKEELVYYIKVEERYKHFKNTLLCNLKN
tara:strand:+ start:97 stop:489 length:393 start_codon:yes stop_codon:yes gene_type:complete